MKSSSIHKLIISITTTWTKSSVTELFNFVTFPSNFIPCVYPAYWFMEAKSVICCIPLSLYAKVFAYFNQRFQFPFCAFVLYLLTFLECVYNSWTILLTLKGNGVHVYLRPASFVLELSALDSRQRYSWCLENSHQYSKDVIKCYC